jgi:AcrR family transcriptional regulator
MGITERKERDSLQMKRRILKTAMKLFLDKGYENVTIRRIATKIEYSPATIYLYYKDKNEILYDLQNEGFEMLFKAQQEVLAIEDPWERLRKHGRVYVTFALENREYYDLMFIIRGPAKKIKEQQEWEAGFRSYDFLKENVVACMKAGYLPEANPDVATFAFWSLTHGIVSLIIRDRCIMYPEEHLTSIIEGALDFVMTSIEKGT